MKPNIYFLLIVLVLSLSACQAAKNTEPLPTVMLQENSSALSADGSDPNGSQSTLPSGGVTASGVLISDHSANLAFQQSGNVKAIHFNVGESVKKGDVLIDLEDTLLKLQLDQANIALQELTSQNAISSAQKTVAEARSAYNRAQGIYYWWLETNSNEDLITKAKADLTIAQDALRKAEEDYNKLSGDAYSDKDKAISYQKLYDARIRVKEAKSQVDLYEGADPFQMEIYKADVAVAKANLDAAETLLAALTGEDLPENPAGPGYAELQNARISVALAEASLANSKLVSPINGVVAELNSSLGSFVQAGQVQMVVVDPIHLHVETTDLSERDVAEIKVGQSVEISIDPVNEIVSGKVSAISAQASSLGGDTIYKVIIRLDTLPEKAYPGMSVTVRFEN